MKDLLSDAYGKVLDLGCGTGFAHEVRPELDMIGVDISDGMLKLHKGLHAKMDAAKLTFPDKSFSFVLCRSLLHHVPDHKAVLSEIKRVLRPGCKAVFYETHRSSLAKRIRNKTQHGDRFSEFHHSFLAKELEQTIGEYLDVLSVRYSGFMAYPLFGFPDIIDFEKRIPFARSIFSLTWNIDKVMEHIPLVKKLSWGLIVEARRR